MQPHTRAMIAASAFAVIAKEKVAGVYDHAAARHLKIAAECRGDQLQAFDGDRSASFGGTLPNLYDHADAAFVSLKTAGMNAEGYDQGSGSFYTAKVTDGLIELYDYGAGAWFAYNV